MIFRAMGCLLSLAKENDESQAQRHGIFVFVPGMRIPTGVNFARALDGQVSSSMVKSLSDLRTRIQVIATGEGLTSSTRPKRKPATQDSKLTISDLQQALEDYLPVLLGLIRKGNQLRDAVEFAWTNQEDKEQETMISSSLYELLSVLHFMAMLGLSQVNIIMECKASEDGYQLKTVNENKIKAIDTLLKISGILQCAINTVLPQMQDDIKEKLPADLKEGVLRAFSMQALGQIVEIQLGLASENLKASIAVKRRLACEQVKYWKQAQEAVQSVHVGSRWGKKHSLFVNWKFMEAKAAAYYYHGIILDERNEENAHTASVACFAAADRFLKESKQICTDFCKMAPETWVPPLWGAMKYLQEKIPKELLSKTTVKRFPEIVPDLPDFPLALKVEDYELPDIDVSWEMEGDFQSKEIISHNGPCMEIK